MYKKIVIANWKANPATLAEAQELFWAEVEAAKKHPGVKTVICPPFVFLEELSKLSREYLGAQDFSDEIRAVDVKYALIGHSDRRYRLGETDEVVNQKLKVALAAGITPVLLVGERNKGDDRKAVLEEQLTKDLANLTTSDVRKLLICYEPVWAISAHVGAQADTPENALEAISIIRSLLNSKFQIPNSGFLYGGSVSEKNVTDFLSHPEIGGILIGGVSLRKEEFARILETVSQIQ